MRVMLLAAASLSACTSLVPATVMQLSGLSPLTADPADFAVSLDLPEGVAVTPGSARLTFSVMRSDLRQIDSETMTLMQVGDVFAISPQDQARLRAIQTRARGWKAQAPDATEGSLSLSLAPCGTGYPLAPDARVNVGVRLSEDGPFLPLVRNGPLSAVAEAVQIADMPPCAGDDPER